MRWLVVLSLVCGCVTVPSQEAPLISQARTDPDRERKDRANADLDRIDEIEAACIASVMIRHRHDLNGQREELDECSAKAEAERAVVHEAMKDVR